MAYSSKNYLTSCLIKIKEKEKIEEVKIRANRKWRQ